MARSRVQLTCPPVDGNSVRRRFGLLFVLLVAAVGPLTSGSGAQGQDAPVDPYAELLLESNAYTAALAARDQTVDVILLAERRIPEIERLLDDLRVASRAIADGIPRLEDQIRIADEAVDAARDDILELAVLQYVYAGGDALVEPFSAIPDTSTSPLGREFVIDTVAAGHAFVLETSRERRDSAVRAAESASGDIGGIDERIAGLERELEATRVALADARAALPDLERTVEDERSLSRVTGTDLTLVVVKAYFDAAKTLQRENPECGIRWELLAGIGRVESWHGTFGGATVGLDGDVSPDIIGIPLNGANETAVIVDSDGGAMDGDIVWDRAVGPMQFIPSTWRAFGRDGNGDGVADPQNVFDAALAAADYLCARGPIDTAEGEVGAILRYNASMTYVRAVQGNALRYDALDIGD